MLSSILLGATFAGFALAAPQGSPTTLAPPSSVSGCASTYDGGAVFQLGIVNASSALAKRQVSPNAMPGNSLMLTLSNGQLTDETGRHGYIASNNQLQFDNPIQSDAIYTAGWTACPNGTLALLSDIWWECLTTYENRTFFNIYDQSIGGQCSPAFLMIIPETTSSSSTSAVSTTTATVAPGSTLASGTPVVSVSTTVVTPVSQLSDGQPQVTTGGVTSIKTATVKISTILVTQITDGQVQGGTTPISLKATGTVGIISQITDGQIQAPTNATTLMPFISGASQPINTNSAMTVIAIFSGFICLGAFLL